MACVSVKMTNVSPLPRQLPHAPVVSIALGTEISRQHLELPSPESENFSCGGGTLLFQAKCVNQFSSVLLVHSLGQLLEADALLGILGLWLAVLQSRCPPSSLETLGSLRGSGSLCHNKLFSLDILNAIFIRSLTSLRTIIQ